MKTLMRIIEFSEDHWGAFTIFLVLLLGIMAVWAVLAAFEQIGRRVSEVDRTGV